ncbi:phosphodiesterase [Motiliproteus coralliicola]|uniref:Phosphodiesterase n=1 Tax=Motiliproteus coralliicola TaxID=2283196 RepID=A0A369WV25_9GAMM|nr:GGDEF domain-containing phosphodiesterase [Motiliproteus coralliicola]RDE24919.1 phosphodiesterase [Motiliproteus coralliicola]
MPALDHPPTPSSNVSDDEQSLKQLAALFDHNPLSAMVVDDQGLIRYLNPACCRCTGFAAEQLLGQPVNVLRSDLTPDSLYPSIRRTLARGVGWSGELCCRRASGKPVWLRVHLSPFKGPAGHTHTLVMMEALLERLEYEQWLSPSCSLDALTGLPTRSQVEQRLRQMVEQNVDDDQRILLLSIDIYRFKQFNESLGHQRADELLVAVAQRLKQRKRGADELCRLGGDQFMLLTRLDRKAPTAYELAQSIQNDFNEPIMIEGQRLFVGLSIGLACFPDDGQDPVQLLQHADTALYRAKKLGRNRIARFEPALEQQALELQQLEAELRYALQKNELEIHYQPLISLDCRVVGAEAVMRWNSPSLGQVLPDQFVALAESIEVIHQIGAWGLEQACAQAKRWLDEPSAPDFVAVNVSPRQLCHEDFVDQVKAALAQQQLPAAALELEITEGVLLNNRDQAARQLERLGQLGVRLSLDDFGTGYSSLSYLQHLPFDTLKIDRSFVTGLPVNRDNGMLVKAIISMAKSLGLRLVAEGVENREQLTYLQALGCDLLQGYYFTEPLQAQRFIEWCRHQPLACGLYAPN